MSIYQSEANLTNTSSSEVTLGTITVGAGESITYWSTTGTRVKPSVFEIFGILRENLASLENLVSVGTLVAVQDDLTLTLEQFQISFNRMSEAVDKASSLDALMFASKVSPTQSDGVPLYAPTPRVGDDWVVGSHNFADSCTWFQDSVRVISETLVDSGDHLTFTSTQPAWIDMLSGRMHNESYWVARQKKENPSDPHGYAPQVYIDGVLATMREPFETSGGDYEVIWEEGKVTFFTSQAGKVITADFSYPTTSYFHLASRKAGYVVMIEDAEADFSMDCLMTDELVYSWWAYIEAYGGWVQVGEYSYARMGQIATEARGNYPLFYSTGCTEAERAMGLPEFRRKSRGMKSDRQAIPFNYSTVRKVPEGVEMRVFTRHHRVLGGEHVTVTMYCTERKDS